MMMERRGHIDKVLLGASVAIALLGVFFVYSATWGHGAGYSGVSPMVIKQAVWVVIGFFCLFLITNIDYRKVLNYAYPAYILSLAALVFLLVFGGERYGARRWIEIGPLSLQPSEFIKLTAILVLAFFIGERREKRGTFGNFIGAFLIILPAMGLIFLQPDLGTAIVILPILFSILFICGENIKYMVTTMILGAMSLPFFWALLKGYQKTRLLVFINPDLDPLGAGYTIIQSKIAIGSGGLFGKGWLNGTQNYLRFLPERHTDFIFSVIGEEWGFLGSIVVLTLFSVVIWRGLRIVVRTKDIYGKAIATGVVTLISFQVLVNISMTIGFMPVVGLPLPAISYGGSNTIASLVGIGFLLSISRKTEG
jgi:rod shape determining protein RodA